MNIWSKHGYKTDSRSLGSSMILAEILGVAITGKTQQQKEHSYGDQRMEISQLDPMKAICI